MHFTDAQQNLILDALATHAAHTDLDADGLDAIVATGNVIRRARLDAMIRTERQIGGNPFRLEDLLEERDALDWLLR